MRQFIEPAILILCLAALVAADATVADTDYSQVAEDIDVMSRVIDKTLDGKFPEEYNVRAFSPFRATGGCQGIYLKGYGAVFMTSISFPMMEQKASEEKADSEDLWVQTRKEIRGTSSIAVVGMFSKSDADKSYDPTKVQQLKEELIRLIGKYGSNIRQLDQQERIIIAVQESTPSIFQLDPVGAPVDYYKLSGKVKKDVKEPESVPRSSIYIKSAESKDATEAGLVSEYLEPEVVVDEKEGKVAVAKGGDVFAYRLASDKVARRTTLIVTVSKENIMAYKNGKLGFDEFVRNAETIQY